MMLDRFDNSSMTAFQRGSIASKARTGAWFRRKLDQTFGG